MPMLNLLRASRRRVPVSNPDDDLAWAVSEFAPLHPRMERYKLYRNYYEGVHPVAYASDKWRNQFWRLFRHFSLNLCSSVVDVQADMLEIVGFTSSAATVGVAHATDPLDTSKPRAVVNDPLAADAWNAWERNGMDVLSDQVHRDAFLYGDGFLMAQPGDNGLALWPQQPHSMAVRYSQDVPPFIECAAKVWYQDNKTVRLNVYSLDAVRRWTAIVDEGVPLAPQQFSLLSIDPNPLEDRVPVFHFPNKAVGMYGTSELRDVLPVQDELNKIVMDMIVAMEFQAFRQRWVAGIELETDEGGRPIPPQHGPGEIFTFPSAEDIKVGEFAQGEIGPFIAAKNAAEADIARVSGIPLHYFFVTTGEAASGEALKTAEFRFARKAARHKRIFGRRWESVVAALASSPPQDFNAVWANLSPRSDAEQGVYLLQKKAMGVPNAQLQKELGYDDDQIAVFHEVVGETAPEHPSVSPAGGAGPVS